MQNQDIISSKCIDSTAVISNENELDEIPEWDHSRTSMAEHSPRRGTGPWELQENTIVSYLELDFDK